MIANALEYGATKAALKRLREGLAHVEDRRDERDPLLQEAMRESIESEIEVLRQQLEEYEALRGGRVAGAVFGALSDLPDVLIAARIAAGWSQKDLAQRLGLKHQQIQRYEATRYSGAGLDRLADVAEALGLELHGEVTFGRETGPIDGGEAPADAADRRSSVAAGGLRWCRAGDSWEAGT